MHQSYEVYVERRFREAFEPFRQALLQGAREGRGAREDIQTRLAHYIKQAKKRHNPIFYYLFDTFGQELLGAFDQMDRNSQLDLSIQTNRCSADAARVIFKETNLSKLDFLDRITGEILFDVGRMLGMLFAGYSSKS